MTKECLCCKTEQPVEQIERSVCHRCREAYTLEEVVERCLGGEDE